MADPTFVSNRIAELPTAFRDPEGEAWATGMGTVQDGEAALLRTAALAGVPQYCPDDALDQVGGWMGIPRLDGEVDGTTTTGYRGRLCSTFTIWEKAGAPQSIIDSLVAYGIADVTVELDYTDVWMPGDWYSRFWVVLGPTMPWTEVLLGTWVLGEGTLGSSATRAEVIAVKKQVLQWKDVRGYPVAVVLNWNDIQPPFGADVTMGATILGGGPNFTRWEIGKIYGLDTFMPYTLGGYTL